MEDLDKKIKKVMNSKIQEPVNYEQKILNTIRRNSNKLGRKERRDGSFIMKKRIIATACASLVLVSGIVVAANIENIKTHFRGLGKGVDTAIENGYIATPNTERTDTNTIAINEDIKVDNINTKINIENFLMDDVNLSTQILFEFDNKIKEIVDLDEVTAIELTDLIVRDEENRIIYGGNNEERFKKYCEDNNLNYTFSEFNDNYMNCGVNCFTVTKDNESNTIRIMYNMYTDKFPKSKKLYFSFGKIEMLEFNETENTQNRIIVNGNWEISVDVPEKMYNRTEEYYEVVSCDHPDFKVYASKVTNTGFEIGVIISNIEQKEYPEELWVEERKIMDKYMDVVDQTQMNVELNKLWSNPKYREMKEEYEKFIYPIQVTESFSGEEGKNSYVENANGQKYESTMSPSRNAKTYYIEGNKYDFYETFSMTKNDATDKVKVVLYYYGEPVTIELQKTNS